jgi:hypothetical protein
MRSEEEEPENLKNRHTNERWELIQCTPTPLSSKIQFHLFREILL